MIIHRMKSFTPATPLVYAVSSIILGIILPGINGYCLPTNTTCWPSDSVRKAFEASLDGSSFLPGSPGYNEAKYVKNWAYITTPALVVSAKSVADVQKSIQFGRKFNLSMSFLSSGHDYIGRNTGEYTLMVRMNELNKMTVFPNDSNSPTGSSMIAETGANWGSVYKEVDKYNKVAVGGAAHTVAMGGWFLGGGHSPLSRKLGLGVDQILSFAVVLPDGEIANVSATGIVYSNGTKLPNSTDLFWALRGGGGGALAIVTSFHFKLHTPPAGGFVTLFLAFPWYHGYFGSIGDVVLDTWNKLLADYLNENWGGYVIITHVTYTDPTLKIPVKGNILLSLVHWGPWSEAINSIKPLLDFHPEWRWLDMKNKTSFWEYTKENKDDLNGNSYIVNRLIQPSDLRGTGAGQKGISNLASAFKKEFDEDPDLPESRFFLCTGTSLGKKTTEPSADATAIGPSFRTALMSLSCGTGWKEDKDKEWMKGVMKNFADKLYKLDGGVYYNEPDSDLKDWKTLYWGSNYLRLHEIKKKYDATNFLTCLHCIGYSKASLGSYVVSKLLMTVTTIVTVITLYIA
ncbi:uncharacterized protein LOC141907101 [Tubulanus polymorphus]|uniref:uncharacterized protein LOC141907101 n=1 Tax=Tubulanus polymorphus TaxID=672921 RepID=UPI003DA1ED1D